MIEGFRGGAKCAPELLSVNAKKPEQILYFQFREIKVIFLFGVIPARADGNLQPRRPELICHQIAEVVTIQA